MPQSQQCAVGDDNAETRGEGRRAVGTEAGKTTGRGRGCHTVRQKAPRPESTTQIVEPGPAAHRPPDPSGAKPRRPPGACSVPWCIGRGVWTQGLLTAARPSSLHRTLSQSPRCLLAVPLPLCQRQYRFPITHLLLRDMRAPTPTASYSWPSLIRPH